MTNTVSVFKLTDDDWCSSFTVNTGVQYFDLVEVSFIPFDDSDGWRVCCWGDDDFGLEKDFFDEREAWGCFVSVIGMEKVSISKLIDMEFVGA